MNKHSTLMSALCGIVFLTATSSVLADDNALSGGERTKREATGVVSGAVIGGLVGGPIGAIATAGFGAWVGNLTVAKKESQLMAQALGEQEQEFIALQAEYRALEARYQVAVRDIQAARVRNASFESQDQRTNRNQAACCSDSEVSLHFKSGSTTIETLYDQKLADIAALVKDLPDTVIEITGHADRRGDSAANLALSQRRIQAVENRLRELGVRNRAIQTSAFGETRPVTETDTLENNFFDRRVVVKVVSAGNGMLTRAND